LNYPKQSGAYQQTLRVNGDPVASDFGTADFWGNGGLFNMAFLFTARYGFLPTPEQPFGRLQPMVGVGPVLMVNWFNPKIRLTSRNGFPVDDTIDFDGKTSVNVGLAAEAVLRYYPLQNVFVDLGYRFTYGQPSFCFERRNFRMTFDNALYTHRLALGVGLSF
jgi:opacity protein-like surface antigen